MFDEVRVNHFYVTVYVNLISYMLLEILPQIFKLLDDALNIILYVGNNHYIKISLGGRFSSIYVSLNILYVRYGIDSQYQLENHTWYLLKWICLNDFFEVIMLISGSGAFYPWSEKRSLNNSWGRFRRSWALQININWDLRVH